MAKSPSHRRLHIAILAAAAATSNGFGFYAPSASIHSSKCVTGKRSRRQQLELYVNVNNNIDTKSRSNNLLSTLLATAITTATLFSPLPSHSADYGSFTPEQRFIAEAWRTVDNSYLDRTFNNQNWFQLRQDAINKKYKNMDEARAEVDKMLSTLGDRYTRYLSPSKYDSMVNAATGNVFGVGVELAMNNANDRVIVGDVEMSGPAAKEGIKPNDVIIRVDGVEFTDGKATPDDVAGSIRGPAGSKVGMTVERDGKSLDFILTREPIKITSVRSYVGDKSGLDGKVGVVRIKSFSGTTAETVKSALEDLKKKGAKSYVLDLRGNPGGLLPGGVDTASLFLDANKPVVFVVNKSGVVDSQATLSDGFDLTTPLTILVDHNTASAAEVMTACLQENGRAVVAGEQTFGKGIVQTIRQLDDNNGGVAVTIARYETPKHNNINKKGVTVDVAAGVDCAKDDALACLPREAFKKL
jgi:carboxyl-terminal processing protease